MVHEQILNLTVIIQYKNTVAFFKNDLMYKKLIGKHVCDVIQAQFLKCLL